MIPAGEMSALDQARGYTQEAGSHDQIMVSISVISHAQSALVVKLLADVNAYCHGTIEVLLTLNIEEPNPADLVDMVFPVTLIRNSSPKGFGANHNAAFRLARGKHFCVVNPDIRFHEDVPASLLACLNEMPEVGVVAPLVRNKLGGVEDSARRFPNILTPFLRALGRANRPDYSDNLGRFEPDWVAGMFMLFPASVYAMVGGFDEKYFLYYEDVDLCARLRMAGYRVVLDPKAVVIHDARRESHRKLKYLRWHVRSAVRFFTSSVYRHICARTEI